MNALWRMSILFSLLFLFGNSYEFSQPKEGDLKKAISMFEPRALWAILPTSPTSEFSNGYHQFLAGNYGQSLSYFQEAASKTADRSAQYILGEMYFRGFGVKADIAEAARWFSFSANQGLPASQFRIGMLYEGGQGVVKSASSASFWITKSADAGFPEGQLLVGSYYVLGTDRPKNIELGYRYINLAASQNYAPAQRALGYLFKYGIGVERSQVEAFEWFKSAAHNGDELAQENLGEFYFRGIGTPRNFESAYIWLKVALSGHVLIDRETTKSQLDFVASKLSDARLRVAASAAQKQITFEKSYELKAKEKALVRLGVDLYQRSDFDLAYRVLSSATSSSYSAIAKVYLGDLYRMGEGVPQQFSRAMQLYAESAEAGYPPAEFQLGLMHAAALGVPESLTISEQRLVAAAAAGDSTIQLSLAKCFSEGRAVRKNSEKAYLWATISAQKGNRAAILFRDDLVLKLTGVDSSSVNKKASEYVGTPSQYLSEFQIDEESWARILAWYDKPLDMLEAERLRLLDEERQRAAQKAREEQIKKNKKILEEMQYRY